MQTLPIPDSLPIQSRIEIVAFENVPDELDSLDALKASLIRQHPHLIDAPPHVLTRMIAAGHAPGAQVRQRDGGHNQILRGFYEDLFARFGGSPTSNQTLEIAYLALGTSYAATTFTQTDLTNETYRAVPSEPGFDDGTSTYYATLYLSKSQANPATTTVSSATSTTITVASATGMIVGARIQIETVNNTYNATITNVASTTLTVNAITGGSLSNASAFDAADIPAAADVVTVLLCEGGCIIGNDATGSANTGKAMNRRRLETLKNTSISLLLNYILTATSVET